MLIFFYSVENKRSSIAQSNTKQKEKWLRDIGCFEDDSFAEVVAATKSTCSRMFQYKLINRFLATNKYLKIIGIKKDDRCTFCLDETETLTHMYWHCPKVQSFIADTKSRLFYDFRINLSMDKKNWFFPTGLSAMETCIITIAKRVVYESRLKEIYPSFSHLKNKLKVEIEIECQSARQKQKHDEFIKKWGPVRGILEIPS